MIAQLNGKVSSKNPESVVLDVNGVGYEVFTPISTYTLIPDPGLEIKLNIQTIVKEDEITLYGFISNEEKKLFKLLINISGLGPKTAITILSAISPSEFYSAISSSNVSLLQSIPKIGPKLAQRIIIELKDKIKKFANTKDLLPHISISSSTKIDLESALLNLGYPPKQVEQTLGKLQNDITGEIKLEELIKKSLRLISNGSVNA